MTKINITTIQFPDIKLSTRDAHKLRGYFGQVFMEQSPLLHNHYETGDLRYKYPLVQYKIIDQVPTLLALEEGAGLLVDLFLKIKELNIDGEVIKVLGKNIRNEHVETGYSYQLIKYRFKTLWMALNQTNYSLYLKANEADKKSMLNKILTGNILSLFKGLNIRLLPEQRLMLDASISEKQTLFKNKKMIAFEGTFITNAQLPNYIGLGKSVSRGFGCIEKI